MTEETFRRYQELCADERAAHAGEVFRQAVASANEEVVRSPTGPSAVAFAAQKPDIYDVILDPSNGSCVVRHANLRPHIEVHAERVVAHVNASDL